VLVFATIIVSLILIFIMPRFGEIYSSMGATLPPLTQWLIDASYVLVHETYKVVIGIIVFVILIRLTYRNKTGKFYVDRFKLKMPIFGTLFLKVAIGRFSDTLATLITAGVPILQSLDIVRETSGNEVIVRAMDGVYDSVKDGETIHEPLRDSKVFPPLVIHMVAVGEETGAIDQMLVKVAEAYSREVDDMVDGLTSILEPLLIVCLGGMVGLVVIALYLPLFKIGDAIK